VNRGLLWKTALELRATTLLFGIALFLVEALLAFVVPQVTDQFSTQIFQLRFVQTIVRGMLGTELGPDAGPETFLTICWVHPVVLSLAWAHAMVCSTRFPAGEVERGTIDVLLSLPVSRGQALVAETLVWMGSTAGVIALGISGNLLGGLAAPPEHRIRLGAMAIVGLNLFAVNLTVGGLGWLVSAASQRRGKAITNLLIAVLGSFLLNYLAQFWSPAKSIVFLSVLNYYSPLLVLRRGAWPWSDLAVLAGVGTVLWTAALGVLARRDLSTT